MTRKKKLKPSLKDYLRTGIVRMANEEAAAEEETQNKAAEIPEAEKVSVQSEQPLIEVIEERELKELQEPAEQTEQTKQAPQTEHIEQIDSSNELTLHDAIQESEIITTAAPEKTEEETETVLAEEDEDIGPESEAQEEITLPPAESENTEGSEYDDTQVSHEKLIQDVLALLCEPDKGMWEMMLKSVEIGKISCSEIDLAKICEDFKDADKNISTFYLLGQKGEMLSPVRTSAQIREPVRCILKWNEAGSAEIYI